MRGLVIDEGASSVLALCRLGSWCPWFELHLDRVAARRGALEHVRSSHPREDQAAKTLEQWLRRNVSANVGTS